VRGRHLSGLKNKIILKPTDAKLLDTARTIRYSGGRRTIPHQWVNPLGGISARPGDNVFHLPFGVPKRPN
jgi:hypothetical protein